MARACSIALYQIKVNKPGKDKEGPKEINLHDKVGVTGTSFFEFLDQFTQKYQAQMYSDTDDENLLRIVRLEKKADVPYYINGIVEKGDHGITSILHHIHTHSEKTRTREEAELLPYFFLVAETTNPQIAILCLGRSGNIGVKTLFQDVLKKEFKASFSDKMILSVIDYLPGFSKEQFIKNNKVRKISYTYMAKVSDAASLLMVNGAINTEIDDAVITVSVKPRRGMSYAFKEIGDKLNLSGLKQNIISMDDSKKIETSVTFENQNGKQRTFGISENRDILPYIDIEAKYGEDGHPTFQSIADAVHDILVEDKLIAN